MAAAKPVRMRFERLKIFTGNANRSLAQEICDEMSCTMGQATVRQFSDGEIHLQIQENVRGADVFVVQPTWTPVDRHLMELLLMMDALEAGVGGTHHGSVTLLWVCPAGPKGPAEDADFGQAGGQL